MHFVMTVVSKSPGDVERLLEPYQENNMGDVDPRYLAFEPDEDCEPVELDDLPPGASPDLVGRRGYFTNPHGYWDWWVIGGRWSDRLLRKDGTRCDQAYAGELDFAGVHREARIQAADLLRRYEAAVAEHGPVRELSIFDRSPEDPWQMPPRERIQAFWAQPTLVACRVERTFTAGDGSTHSHMDQPFDLEDLHWIRRSPGGWVEGQAARALIGNDLLTHEGVWMGVHGWNRSYDQEVDAQIGFLEAAGAYLMHLTDDMVVTSVDYHS
jgi:hypothetical protein